MALGSTGLVRDDNTTGKSGLLVVKSNSTLAAEKAKAEQEAKDNQNTPLIVGLSADLTQKWEVAKTARTSVEQRLLDCLRRRQGEYSPEKMASIKATGGSEVFMMLTSIKCRAAESWINDILFPAGDRCWEAEPTPIPDLDPEIRQELAQAVAQEAMMWMQQNGIQLPPEIVQQRMKMAEEEIATRLEKMSRETAEKMSKKIDDQFTEGKWEEAMRELVKNTVTFPTAFIKGPVIRKRKSLKWMQDGNGKWMPKVASVLRPEYYSPSPFDLYFSPSSKNVQDGYLFERHRLRRKDILAMKGVPGYDSGAIDAVLSQYGMGGLRNWLTGDQQRAELEGRPNEWLGQTDTIDALEYWGSASGRHLLDWGMDPAKIPDPNMEYEVNCWKIGSYVIKAVLNESPTGERPYDQCSFEDVPGSIWGKSVPELMADVQDVCNAAARSLVNNMAVSSGPQIEVHTDRLAIGEDISNITPFRIWQTLSDPNGGTNNPAVRFNYPQSIADQLMKVYEFFSTLADEYTNIPKYSYGDNKGAPGTASGLSMLMSSAARGIKQVIANLDTPIEGTVRRTYIHNMLFDEDEAIKGDLSVSAKGARSMVAKEQQMVRRQEFLQTTNNPTDLQIMGMEGRAMLLREAVKAFEINVDDVIPDREKLQEQMQQAMQAEMQQQQQAAAQGGQAGPAPGGSRNLDQAGNPAGGTDTRLIRQAA
jgi:hypothetical protein